MAIDYSQNPYYDDYDETKDFHRLLFRPGYAVQSRELTQLQTVLQKQVDRFGSHVFKNGSLVSGGQLALDIEGTHYLKLQTTTLTDETVVVSHFIDTFITDTQDLGVRAYVIAADAGIDGNPPTLMIKYVSQAQFHDNQNIQTENGAYQAITVLSGATGQGSVCSIDEGVFFINGIFVRVARSTIVLERYSTTPSYRIGLEIHEDTITENQDASLLDPALESSNYLAPGSHRYRIQLIFAKRLLTSTDDSSFLELMRVENGKLLKKIKYPVYSDLETTLARRTYDESGNYTVRAFQIALQDHPTDENKYNIILEPGKAYVLGYEFETSIPVTLDANRARNTQTVYNYPIGMDYQNYVEVTNMMGMIPLDTYQPINVYCVPSANVSTSDIAAANAVWIGTASIRALDYLTGITANTVSGGLWRAHIMNTNIISHSGTSQSQGTANTIFLSPDASSEDNVYNGVNIRIVSHQGKPYNVVRRIKSYQGNIQTATIESTFAFLENGYPDETTIYSLDFEFKDAESLVYNQIVGGTIPKTASMDIAPTSKLNDAYSTTYVADTDFNTAIFKFPNDYIVAGVNSITNTEFYGYKVYSGQFSANVFTFSTTTGITAAAGAESPLSSSSALENFLVVARTSGGPGFANNQIINFASGTSNTISVLTAGNTSTFTITAPGAFNQYVTAYVKVKVPYAHATSGIRKIKRLKTANPTTMYSGPAYVQVDPHIRWSKQDGYGSNVGAQIVFTGSGINNLKIPNYAQSIYTADVVKLRAVYDFGSNNPTTANLALATDVTSSYVLDNGQRDNMYDHATIALIPNRAGTKGNTVVFVDYCEHVGSGYLTADSYIDDGIDYEDIPTYVSQQSAEIYRLSDCVDFRPRRQNGDTVGAYDSLIFPVSGTNFETDFSYYLPRIDKVLLTKDRTFEVIEGIPSLTPNPPSDNNNAMTLYILTLPPYTSKTSTIRIKYIDNRRYTMRDIGTLEQRLAHVEYYTTLNQLEQAAKSQEVLDEQTGLNRVKNGIIVDPFRGHNIGDVTNPDYLCSIDKTAGELRPAFYPFNINLMFDPTTSSNYKKNGHVLTLDYTEIPFIEQPLAALAINVNPFNVVTFLGKITLDPSSDSWVDTDQKPDVLVNLDGGADGWMSLASKLVPEQSRLKLGGLIPANQQAYDNHENYFPNSIVFGTQWNAWQENFTGVIGSHTSVTNPQWRGWLGPLGTYVPVYEDIVKTTTTDILHKQTRTGVRTIFTTDVITKSLGDRVVDTSIVPYIRSRGVLFVGKGFLADTPLYAFFDQKPVQNYVVSPNKIEVDSNNVVYIDTYQDNEFCRIYEPATGANIAFGRVALCRSGDTTMVTVVNIEPGDNIAAPTMVRTSNTTYLIGETSGANTRILRYYHSVGTVQGAGTSQVVLDTHMMNAETNTTGIIGKDIYFVAGPGSGQKRTITSYTPSTRTAILDTALTTSVSAGNTRYSIGQFQSDARGECVGVFVIPSDETIRFRTGERTFRLVDMPSTDLSMSKTNGDAVYFAQGLLQTKEESIISVRVPSIRRETVNDSREFVSHTVTREVVGRRQVGYWDPLAQTFLVDQTQYENGIHLTGVRLVFRSKDEQIPIQVQIRPVVNGYPHSSQVVPFADILVNPDSVKTVSEDVMMQRFLNPSLGHPLDDPSLYTEVKFDAPIVLQPGTEYCVVLIANTIKYEVYISQVGKTILGTDRLISTQPYLGSLFKSQNSSTWTAAQDQDLMFRLMRASYNTSAPLVCQFELDEDELPTANVAYDTFFITKQNLLLPNTSFNAQYQSTLETGGLEVFKPFEIENNMYFEDTFGRRMITTDPGSFKVKMFFSSASEQISPFVDGERLTLLCVHNLVNDLELTNSSIVVTNTNSQFTNTANIVVSISGGGGSGAEASAVVSNNQITGFNVTLSGSKYTSSPTITITGGGVSANATAVVVGEDQPSGGPAVARYITRKVALADGFDAGDLRVYLTAYKPPESEIYVYYKVLSADDATTFESRPYVLMTPVSGYNAASANFNDLHEYAYAPGDNYMGDNRVTYPGFGSFRYFAIKIVMTSTNPTHVPRIKNFRAIALPALSPA